MDAEIEAQYPHPPEIGSKDLTDGSVTGLKSGSLNSEVLNGSNSDLSANDDEDNGDDMAYEDGDVTDYDYGDDDDDEMLYDEDGEDHYLSMQAQFDNVDLPPGVEASVSWLEEPSPSSNVSTSSVAPVQENSKGLHIDVGSSVPSYPGIVIGKNDALASSSASVSGALVHSGKEKGESSDDVMRKYENFKHFDTVDDYSDHHYTGSGFQGGQPPKAWAKKIQDEWKILESNLPDTIYVRVYETRMDLLRAVIVGPQGTPYHDGLFVFDVLFPPSYPSDPPMVYYYSGGLRLNPNLYDCGKVCLSLLNTWSGKGNEKWIPKSSTMLQVLVSIQALILNAKPFFNEPGYDKSFVGAEGERKSNAYNEDVFILSLKTMMYTLRRPPKHFEDLVAGHFSSRAYHILSACKAYMNGATVGSLVNGGPSDDRQLGKCSADFKAKVGRMVNGLVTNFTRYGAKDCEQFRLPS